MPEWLDQVLSILIGDHRHYSIERRLFNTISLLNAAANIGGAFAALISQTPRFLFFLHFGTGILFAAFYYLGRFRNAYHFCGRSALLLHCCSGDRNYLVGQGVEDDCGVPGGRRDDGRAFRCRAAPPRMDHPVRDSAGDVQEFSYKEVAATLGVPVGTVMSRLSRGRKLLRAELSAFAEGYGIREKGKSA